MRVPLAELIVLALLIAAGHYTVPPQPPSRHFIPFKEIAAVRKDALLKTPELRPLATLVIQPPKVDPHRTALWKRLRSLFPICQPSSLRQAMASGEAEQVRGTD